MTKRILLAGAYLGILLATLLACAATEDQLRSRAAFDMKCPQGKLQVTEIDPRTKGVRGCGQQGTYVESCDQQQVCTWVLNTETRPQHP